MNEIIQYLCRGNDLKIGYPSNYRLFCMTIHYISPRAYNYLRQKSYNHMPHPQTLRQWYRNSNLDSSSGISKHSLLALENKAKEMADNGQQLTVSLVFDEMSIQRNMM